MVEIAEHPMSLQEYLSLPDDVWFEVADGQPVVTPSPTGPHQRAITRLLTALSGSCPAGYEILAAPFDWVLWEAPRLTLRQPDLVVVTHEQADGPRLTTPPLLAVEVLSPHSIERDTVTKRREYAQAGVGHYWLVNLEVPQIVAYAAQRGELREIARAAGDEELALSAPFDVRIRPAGLC